MLLCSTGHTSCLHSAPLTSHAPNPSTTTFTRPPPGSRQYAQLLAAAFEKRAELRVPICHALRRLCAQNRAVLAAAGEPVGHADPSAVAAGAGDDEAAASQEDAPHLEIPDGFTPEMARK